MPGGNRDHWSLGLMKCVVIPPPEKPWKSKALSVNQNVRKRNKERLSMGWRGGGKENEKSLYKFVINHNCLHAAWEMRKALEGLCRHDNTRLSHVLPAGPN